MDKEQDKVNTHEVSLNPMKKTDSTGCKSPKRTRHYAKTTPETPEDQQDEIVPIENVQVKFRLSETQVIAQIYPNCLTLGEMKVDIARRFEVPKELLHLKQGKCFLSDDWTICETECDAFGIHNYGLELKVLPSQKLPNYEINSSDSQPKLDLEVYYSKNRLPDFITVYIPAEDANDGEAKNIVVEIQNKAIIKPFLCGYLDKRTGVEYLDAFTQTGPYWDKSKHSRYVCRDTQTFQHKEKTIDTMHDQVSQCWLDGNNVRYWSSGNDVELTPGKYETAAQMEKRINRLAKIRLIQRNFRRWKWVKWMQDCAKEYRRLVANRVAEEDTFCKAKEKRIKREERAKLYPKTKDDFDLLYTEVQKWKFAELKRITSMYEGASRKTEVNILLDKEIQLLNGIERQRQLVSKAVQDFKEQQLLKKLGEPVSWYGYGDTIIHMDLIRTQRVRFLTEIYKDLQKPLAKVERLKLINKVREIILNENCFPDFPELFDLFDRERNLLMYTKNCDVQILRKRQNIIFLELIKFDKEPKQHDKANRMCVVCNQVKPYSEFAIRTRQNQVDTCKKCYYLKMASTDNTVYLSILRSIQREERRKRCNGSFAFIMQVDDIKHIIQQIWHGHSILSKCENINILRLPRWNKTEEWAPWNCVCLTECETRNHYVVTDLEQVYDNKIRLEVGNRHLLARNAFHNLAAVATEFTENRQWWNVGLNPQRTVRFKDITTKHNTTCIPTKCMETMHPSQGSERNYKMGKIL